jgi:hypothetical protein
MHTSKGHLTEDRSGHGVFDAFNAFLCGFRTQIWVDDDPNPETQLSTGENCKYDARHVVNLTA